MRSSLHPLIRLILINIPILACCWSVATVLYGCGLLGNLGKTKLHDYDLTSTQSLGLTANAVPYGIKLGALTADGTSSLYGVLDIPTE